MFLFLIIKKIEMNSLKLIFSITIFLASLASCLIPLAIEKTRCSNALTGVVKTFGAGIFLGLAFLSLYPESSQIFSDINYPLPGLISLITYMLMLFMEKIIFIENEALSHKKNSSDIELNHSSIITNDNAILESQKAAEKSLKDKNFSDEENSFKEPLLNSTHKSISFGTGLTLAFALSIHSAIEGVTIGLQNKLHTLISLIIGISIHKIPEAFVVGIALSSMTNYLKWPMIVFYSLATPFGILLGLLIDINLYPLLEGVFLSICVGNFLYIGASEILVDELSEANLKYAKFFGLVLGIGLISTLVGIHE